MTNAVESSRQPFTPLKRSPPGFSSRDVEHALGLPPGAWKRRRLYALRARSASFKDLGLYQGDYLIVEPGERVRPFQLVVVREQGKTTVIRTGVDALDTKSRSSRYQTAPLPFLKDDPARPTRVVGTVVGLLRRQGDQESPDNGLGKGLGKSLGPLRSISLKQRSGGEEAPADSATIAAVEKRLAQWCSWVDGESVTGVDPGTIARWRGLSLQLATLLKCLKTSRSQRFFTALSGEIRGVLSAMAAQTATRPRSIPTGHPHPGELRH